MQYLCVSFKNVNQVVKLYIDNKILKFESSILTEKGSRAQEMLTLQLIAAFSHFLKGVLTSSCMCKFKSMYLE